MKQAITKQKFMENVVACVRPKTEDNAVTIDWMDDLQVYFRIIIDDGTAIVTEELLDNIGVSKEWLLCIATDNVKVQRLWLQQQSKVHMEQVL